MPLPKGTTEEDIMRDYDRQTKMLQDKRQDPFTTRQVAEAIFEADRIIEDSWDNDSCKYLMDTENGIEIACLNQGVPQLARLVHLAFSAWQNDTIEWAERVLNRSEQPQ